MSESTNEKELDAPINGDDLSRFHAGKDVALPKCWVCGKSSWYIQSEAGQPFNGVPWQGSEERPSPPAFQVLLLSCATCATVWAIDYGMLKNWLKGNPA